MTEEQARTLITIVATLVERVAALKFSDNYCVFCGAYRGDGRWIEEHRATCAVTLVEALHEALTPEEVGV